MMNCKKESDLTLIAIPWHCLFSYEQGKVWGGGAAAAWCGTQRGGQGSVVHPEWLTSYPNPVQVIPDPTDITSYPDPILQVIPDPTDIN